MELIKRKFQLKVLTDWFAQKNVDDTIIFVTIFITGTYSGDLNTGLIWYSNGHKLSDRRIVCYLNAI